jgi:hypothetical protein
MGDWTERLLNEVAKSDESNQQKHTQKQFILEKRKILKDHGYRLWDEFVKACQGSVKTLNAKITAKFPNERSKKVKMELTTGIGFNLFGSDPSFSMAATYDAGSQEITIDGSRTLDGVPEQRRATLKLDLDEEGNPCLTLDGHKISASDASIYILGVGMASTPPTPPR